MSDKIKQLPDTIANQIKAGEVVNRPASVVKELMENAVDAGATNIIVNIKDGGKESIQIIDNGSGMSPGDALRAFDRHATSKIAQVDDLFKLTTFGFRGEALASISSVAEVELKTRTADDELAIHVQINGGELLGKQSVSHPVGSQFIVKNLLFNVPARRKFLKNDSVETKHIISEFQRVVLCNPSIEFSLYNNDSLVYNLLPSNLRQRIISVMGKSLNNQLLDLNVDTSIIKIEGFIGRPKSAKKSNNEQFFFVNGRYFKSPYLHKALVKAYENMIASETSPSYFIHLTIDPSQIDVNIHPQKVEVKFEDESLIWQILNAAVRESLGKFGAVPMMDFDAEDQIEIPVFNESGEYKIPSNFTDDTFNPFEYKPTPRSSAHEAPWGREYSSRKQNVDSWDELYDRFENSQPITDKNWSETEFKYDEESAWGAVHVADDPMNAASFEIEIETVASQPSQQTLELESACGASSFIRIGGNYVAVVLPEGLTVIDLKRAQERILYERFLARMKDSNVAVTQQELFPEDITLTPQEYLMLKSVSGELQLLGLDIEDRGENRITLKGIPADMQNGEAKNLIHSILADLHEGEVLTSLSCAQRVAMSMSKVAGGSKSMFSDAEIEHIVAEIVVSQMRSFTADGKQIMSVIPEEEINKRFK